MPRTAKEKENNPGPKKGTHKKPPQPSEKDAITAAEPEENDSPPGKATLKKPPARQRQLTEKITNMLEEQKAATARRETEKAHKADRARRAKDNGEEGDDELYEPIALPTFKTQTVASKPVSVKTKALANMKPARVDAAPSRTKEVEDVPVEDVPVEDEADEDSEDSGEEADDDEDVEDENRGLSPELNDSQSGADVISLKRKASTSDSLKETKVHRTSSGRPKAADYDESVKPIIISAISYYRAHLSSLRAFPDVGVEATMLSEIWKGACRQFDTSIPLTPQIAKLITSRGSQLRGEIKSKARPLVEGHFGFESGLNRKIIAMNRETAENLKEGKGFIYKIPDVETANRKGIFQAKIIQKVVNAMWFRNKQDEGIIHEENFSPLTIEAVALVLSAIECCIDEWISGVRTDIPFSTALYKDVYEDHIRCLERFNKVTNQIILPNILVKLYNRGRFHAGALPVSRASAPTIPDEMFHAALKEYEDDPKTETEGENGDSD